MTNPNSFQAESEENYQQKCCVVLVLDTSGSMHGQGISQLTNGINVFFDEIGKDTDNLGQKLEIGVITFDSNVNRICEPKLVQYVDLPPLTTQGSTRMVDGVREGVNMVKQRKQYYKDNGIKYYRPWIIMITDGDPDDDQKEHLMALASEIQQGMEKREFCFMAIGVDGADVSVLQVISNSEIPPRMISGLKFADFFKWLSVTIQEVTNGQSVSDAVKSNPWNGGFTV